MPNTLTVTAKTGPAVQNTAIVLTNVARLDYNVTGLVLTVYFTDGRGPKEYDLSGVTTVTTTVSSNVYTVTIS